jgi:hypothetical protein
LPIKPTFITPNRKLEGQVQFQTGRATQKEKEKKEKEVQLKAAVAERDELQLEVQLLKAQLVEAAAAGFKPTTSDPKSRHHNHHAGQHVSTQTEFGERRNLPAGVLEDDTGTETASGMLYYVCPQLLSAPNNCSPFNSLLLND